MIPQIRFLQGLYLARTESLSQNLTTETFLSLSEVINTKSTDGNSEKIIFSECSTTMVFHYIEIIFLEKNFRKVIVFFHSSPDTPLKMAYLHIWTRRLEKAVKYIPSQVCMATYGMPMLQDNILQVLLQRYCLVLGILKHSKI